MDVVNYAETFDKEVVLEVKILNSGVELNNLQLSNAKLIFNPSSVEDSSA
jgi:hypothetical protein